MDTLPHLDDPTPRYATTLLDGVRVVQYARVISREATTQRDAQYVAVHHANLIGQLSVSTDSLRDAVEKWGYCDGDEESLSTAGNALARAANEVLELLRKIGN